MPSDGGVPEENVPQVGACDGGGTSASALIVMWEVRARPGRLADLVRFVLAHADPAAQVFRAEDPDPRVVVIDPSGRGVADPPAELVARPAHQWVFQAVPR